MAVKRCLRIGGHAEFMTGGMTGGITCESTVIDITSGITSKSTVMDITGGITSESTVIHMYIKNALM